MEIGLCHVKPITKTRLGAVTTIVAPSNTIEVPIPGNLVECERLELPRNVPTSGLQPGALPTRRTLHLKSNRWHTCKNTLKLEKGCGVSYVRAHSLTGLGLLIQQPSKLQQHKRVLDFFCTLAVTSRLLIK